MAYKDVLVVLDAGPRLRERVMLAAGLAERFEAHLIGLYVGGAAGDATAQLGFTAPTLLDPLYREAQQRSREQQEDTRRLFEDIAGRHLLSPEFRTAAGYPAEIVALHGRYADLIILGQLDPENTIGPLAQPLPEEVSVLAGRPVLVVPYAGSFVDVGRRALVGWDASREATRAVNDAMPLLAAADTVTVLSVDPEHSRFSHGDIPGADIGLHLSRHGVTAKVERTVSAGIGIGNTLLSRASDLEADLLVMGAYGHSRMRELLLGGVTRTVLASMTLPVLMSH